MAKVMVIDITKCNGCRNMDIGYYGKPVNIDQVLGFKPQRDIGCFRIILENRKQSTLPKIRIDYIRYTCRDCEETLCVNNCKQKAIYKNEEGMLIIDPIKCIKCVDCESICPYEVLNVTDSFSSNKESSWCEQKLDPGWKEPKCVNACPTIAYRLVEKDEVEDYFKTNRILLRDSEVAPGIYIIGLHSKKLSRHCHILKLIK